MIRILIMVDDYKIIDSFKKENITMEEAAIALLKLEQTALEIKQIEFESEFESFAPEEDNDMDDAEDDG